MYVCTIFTHISVCVQLKLLVYLYVYTIIITRIIVCLQNINDSEKY